jgi:putative ABC transport system permease protein
VLQVVSTPGYFDAIGMTFLAGRPFQPQEADLDYTRTAVVNETFARNYWPGKSPIGKRIRTRGGAGKWIEVVGLTRDEKHYGLDQEMKPSVFLPLRGVPRLSMDIILRGSIEPQLLIAPAREILRQLDPDLPMFDIRTMTERLDQSLWARRAYSWLFGSFAIVALVLAAAGIYGVISYAVSQRTQEIGIRMALGARKGQVLRLVMREGGMLVIAGSVLGFLGAVGVSNALAAMSSVFGPLFAAEKHDPWLILGAPLLLAALAMLACYVPARRSTNIDPLVALREE